MDNILASIHGNLCGDGCVSIFDTKRNIADIKKYNRKNLLKKRYDIMYTNNRPELIKKFKYNIKLCFPWVKFGSSRKGEVRIRDKRIITHFLKYSKYGSYEWYIPTIITKGNEELKISWLRSYFDDESTVDKYRIVVGSVNKKGLKQVYNLLKSLKFRDIKFYSFSSKYCIYISKEDVNKFQKVINFDHKIKREKLNRLVNFKNKN